MFALGDNRTIEFLVAIVILFLSAGEFYKGTLMFFRGKHPLLFVAQISFLIIRLFPKSVREERYKAAMNAYIQRRRLYGIFGIAGGFYGILLSFLIIHNLY